MTFSGTMASNMDNVPQSSATTSTAASSMGSSTKSGDGSERDLLEFDEIDPDIEREVGAHAPIPVQQEPSSDAVPFRCGQCGKTPESLPPERQLKRCIQVRSAAAILELLVWCTVILVETARIL